MGTPYVRNDTSNNIADGNVVDAADFDGEFDALVSAFNSTAGHSHDGTTGEGGPVTVLGPVQDWVATANSLYPKNDNAYDLGIVGNELRDLRVDRFAYIDGLIVEETATFAGATIADLGTITTVDINGGTMDGVVIGASTVAEANFGDVYIRDSSGRLTFIDTDVVGVQSAITMDNSGTLRIRADENDNSASTKITFELDGTQLAEVNPTDGLTGKVTITSGAISGITDLAIADGGTGASTAAQAVTNLGFTQTAAQISSNIIPSGGIILWSGSVASIPSGWALCDGTSGTPNLQDRFIVGAGNSYAVGATGGSDSVALTTSQLPSHTHSFTGTAASSGTHTHSDTFEIATQSLVGTFDIRNRAGTGGIISGDSGIITDSGAIGSNTNSLSADGESRNSDRVTIDATHTHGIIGSISSGGAHTHSVSGTTNSTGSGSTHENRPPYYALAYIMKL